MKNVIKSVIVSGAFVALASVAQTTIYYENGSSYILEPNEEIYVTRHDVYLSPVTRKDGWLVSPKLEPNQKRVGDGVVGEGFCAEFDPSAQKDTFAFTTFGKYCDVNSPIYRE